MTFHQSFICRALNDKKARFYIWPFLMLLVIACTSPSLTVSERIDQAELLAKPEKFEKQIIQTPLFSLYSLHSPIAATPSPILDVYIEGDGLAWMTRSLPSQDPTPINPIALKLALKNTHNATAYLARPCQFLNDSNGHCRQQYWTSHRFSKEVVRAENIAIDKLKSQFGSEKVRLFGFSGGGAIAALISAKRHDVELLVTIAGNLNHQHWTRKNGYTPLAHSLNPIDYVDQLQTIKQIHFVGMEDKNISTDVVESYISLMKNQDNVQVHPVQNANHNCCWAERWTELLKVVNKKN